MNDFFKRFGDVLDRHFFMICAVFALASDHTTAMLIFAFLAIYFKLDAQIDSGITITMNHVETPVETEGKTS